MNHRDGVENAAAERLAQRMRSMHAAPLDFERLGFQTGGGGDLVEALTESAVHEAEDATSHTVAHSAFHQSGSRRCGHVNGTLGAKHVLQGGLNARHQIFHLAHAVADHGLQHRLENFRPHLGRSGQEEAAKRLRLNFTHGLGLIPRIAHPRS